MRWDLQGAYRAFEAEARAVAPQDVVTFTGNALVAFHNVRKGVMAVMAEAQRLASDPDAPKVDLARVAQTTRVGEALVFATRRVSSTAVTKGELQAKTSVVYELRDELLANAVAAVKSKVLVGAEAAKVAAIQKGKGPIDAAQDRVDLAALYRTNAAALRGRTAVTAEQIERAAKLGSELLHLLLPSGVRADGAPLDSTARAAEMRDRMAVVLARHYGYVARVGGWLWGLDVAEHVPPLRSRSLRASEGTTDEPAPAPPVPT